MQAETLMMVQIHENNPEEVERALVKMLDDYRRQYPQVTSKANPKITSQADLKKEWLEGYSD